MRKRPWGMLVLEDGPKAREHRIYGNKHTRDTSKTRKPANVGRREMAKTLAQNSGRGGRAPSPRKPNKKEITEQEAQKIPSRAIE